MGIVGPLGRRLTQDRRLAALVLVSATVRLVVVVVSSGSNDVFIWADIAQLVREHGLIGAYEATYQVNHPPLALLYMGGAQIVSETVGLPFAWLVKLPALLGDAVIAILIWRVAEARHGLARARRITAAYLLNPLTILLTAFHGNTDMLYVALAFAAVVALEWRRASVAGLLFGAALNVKVLAVALAAAFASLLWRRRNDLRPFAAGLAASLLPFLVVGLQHPLLIWERTLAYQYPVPALWGPITVEWALRSNPSGTLWYHSYGRLLLAAGLVGAAVLAHRRNLNAFQTVGLAALTFLVFAPSFGIQYLAVAIPFLLVANRRAGQIYCWTAGVYLSAEYANALVSTDPITALFPGDHSSVIPAMAVLVWGVCMWAIIPMTDVTTEAPSRPVRVPA